MREAARVCSVNRNEVGVRRFEEVVDEPVPGPSNGEVSKLHWAKGAKRVEEQPKAVAPKKCRKKKTPAVVEEEEEDPSSALRGLMDGSFLEKFKKK